MEDKEYYELQESVEEKYRTFRNLEDALIELDTQIFRLEYNDPDELAKYKPGIVTKDIIEEKQKQKKIISDCIPVMIAFHQEAEDRFKAEAKIRAEKDAKVNIKELEREIALKNEQLQRAKAKQGS